MYQLPIWVWPTALMSVCALAVWKGRDESRLAAGGLLANWALSMMVFEARSEDIQWPIIATDSGLFALYLWIALRSPRYWPLFLASFALLVLVTHLAHGLDPGVSGWSYLTAELLWSYLMLVALGYGAWTANHESYAGEAAMPETAPGATLR
jgi:hypothetical protein